MPAVRVAQVLSLTTLFLAGCFGPSVQTAPVASGTTRVIHLPSAILGQARLDENRALLAIAPGSEDELPQGPQGFAVMPDGALVVADPLADRLVVFDEQGTFRRSLEIGFAADSIRLEDRGLLVRKAYTGEEYFIDPAGGTPPESRGRSRAVAGMERARMLVPGRGVITPSPTRGLQQESFEVQLETGDLRLISLEYLGSDESGSHYVALEAAGGGDTIEVAKRLQKYTPDGHLVAEKIDVPNDYFVNPVDEFRLHRQAVFHLIPLRDEVRIEVWETGGSEENDRPGAQE